MQSVLLLLPDFATILLGVGVRRWMKLEEEFWAGIEKLVYYVLFPTLLFNALAKTHIDFLSAAPLLAGGLIALTTGLLLGLLAFRLFPLTPIQLASRFQCAFRFNSYIGLAIVGKMYGEEGIATLGVLMGLMVPLANAAAIGMLARHGTYSIAKELARNPLVLATLAGLLWNFLNLPLPLPAAQFLSRLSDATVAMGLLTVGAALRWHVTMRQIISDIYYVSAKLLIAPLAAWWAGRWLGLPPVALGVVVIFASLPTATSSYILAARMGGDGPGVAWLVSAGTIMAMFTMSIWINVVT